jgi:hypothetical protein
MPAVALPSSYSSRQLGRHCSHSLGGEDREYHSQKWQLRRNGPDHSRHQPLVAAEPFGSESQLGLSACFRKVATTAGRGNNWAATHLLITGKTCGAEC